VIEGKDEDDDHKHGQKVDPAGSWPLGRNFQAIVDVLLVEET